MSFELTTADFLAKQQKAESEADFQARVIELARATKWRVAHFRAVRVQRANGTTFYQTPVQADGEGFPDLVLVRDRVLFAELKRENGKLEPKQRVWLDAIHAAGGTFYTWRPSDWEQIVKVLR